MTPRQLRRIVDELLERELEELRNEKACLRLSIALHRLQHDPGYVQRQAAHLEPLSLGNGIPGPDEH